MKHENRKITEEDISLITNISVVYYDCWVANYCDDEPGVIFQNCYENLDQFKADNKCFPTEIIEIEECEGIA
jgi:hypothetical protein